MEEMRFEIFNTNNLSSKKKVIKGEHTKVVGKVQVSFEEDSMDNVKIILNKDENNNIREIKFVCSCGHTKSLILDYEG
ncbi:MAG: hypothetical protein NZM09_07095 [Ignavibacterium sp.]|nr:hypothetical protein [Ignavibacterium sp.]MCX7610855.1 hypothetical protein [Ignavibacterium sp.]MDW8375447.1 hypothetical protein [Ignavibacteriales bacterium]